MATTPDKRPAPDPLWVRASVTKMVKKAKDDDEEFRQAADETAAPKVPRGTNPV